MIGLLARQQSVGLPAIQPAKPSLYDRLAGGGDDNGRTRGQHDSPLSLR